MSSYDGIGTQSSVTGYRRSVIPERRIFNIVGPVHRVANTGNRSSLLDRFLNYR